MKIRVWINKSDMLDKKCIFIGECQTVPRVGERVECREEFGCSHEVKIVTHSLYSGEVSVELDAVDYENNYGECLYLQELQADELLEKGEP